MSNLNDLFDAAPMNMLRLGKRQIKPNDGYNRLGKKAAPEDLSLGKRQIKPNDGYNRLGKKAAPEDLMKRAPRSKCYFHYRLCINLHC